MESAQLTQWLDGLLKPSSFKDYCPNGLQVEGSVKASALVTAVTASQAAIDYAIAQGANALLVHHGLFWGNKPEVVVGMLRQRLASLLAHDINLYAYHLPLDCHSELGNNVLMGKALSWPIHGDMMLNGIEGLGAWADLPQPCSCDAISQALTHVLDRKPHCYSGGDHPIKRIGWCTGAAQDGIVRAAEMGLDAYVSGEVSERTVYQAREMGIHYFSAGHHATERFGIRALGECIASEHGLAHSFFDDHNNV
jgi:dinuclear metal center YbgI/SA1388 family protein